VRSVGPFLIQGVEDRYYERCGVSELKAKLPKSIGLRLMTISAACMLLAAGLCGLGFRADRFVHDGGPSTFDVLGGLGFGLSVVGLVLGVVIGLMEAVIARIRRSKRDEGSEE
jgi:hypothetical protein